MMNEHASYGVPSSSDLWQNERREIEKHYQEILKDKSKEIDLYQKAVKKRNEDITGLEHTVWRLKNGLDP